MENVIKQGYLRKSFSSDRGLSGFLERIDPTKWFVLGVRDGAPYLEYYDKEMDVFSAEPINTFNLSTCRKLAYTHVRHASLHRFSLVLQDRVIELATPDRGKMMEWYNVLESTLASLGVLQKEDHEHVYSFCPAVVNFGASSKKQDEAKTEDDEVFGTVGAFEQQENMKRKESLDKQAMSQSHDLSVCGASRCSGTEDSVSSDYSGSDFMDSDFWQKNKIEDNKELIGAKNNLPTPAVRVSLIKLKNNKSKSQSDEVRDSRNGENLAAVASTAAVGNCSEDTNVKAPLCSSTKASHSNDCNGVNGQTTGSLPSECDRQGTEHSECTADVSCQDSSNQEQKDAKNENFYSDFPVPNQKVDSSNKLMQNLPESDTCVKQKLSTNWVTFDDDDDDDDDDDGSYEPITNSEHPSVESNSSFIRDKLRHSTGSSNTTHCVSKTQLVRHSLDSTTNPPLPPRNDSLPKRQFTFAGKTRDSYQAKAVLANSTQPETNGIPPLPPRRFDSVPEADPTPPPPLPSRDSQNSKPAGPPSLPRRNPGGRSVSESEGGAVAALPGRPHHRLSVKMMLDRSDKAFNVVSLKQSQVEILQLEMGTKEMAVQLTQKDCLGLALVDVYGSVWIAGWNQKDHPRLHDKFHVGDLVKKVNGVTVFTAAMGYKFVRGAEGAVEVVVQRLPHAKVLSVRRAAEGETLGFKREGGSGEIVYVDPSGLAAKHGLSAKAPCIFSQNSCNWFITEINSRPVSLFFKELEIEHRLNAVGKEISLVVQPTDFVSEIKKGLKKMKSYKNYVVK